MTIISNAQPPEASLLPKELRPLRQRVIDARDAWTQAYERRKQAVRADLNSDRDHKDALGTAARNGLDPSDVPDQRQDKAAKAKAATEAEAACADALAEAWWLFTQAVAEHADSITASHLPTLEKAQADTQRLAGEYLTARQQLAQALSFHAWVDTVAIAFDDAKPPPRTGPGPGHRRDVAWIDSRGKPRTITAGDLDAALRVDSSAYDAWRAADQRRKALALRRVGDPAASTSPVPRGKMVVD